MIEGFYSAYMTGMAGEGQAMFIVHKGVIVGMDPLGMRFDGTYKTRDDGTGHDGKVSVGVPANGHTVQGVSSGPSGMTYEVSMTFPNDFMEHTIRIETPLGPVNTRWVKLRGIP